MLLHKTFLSVSWICPSRFPILWQRQTPLLQRLRRSALMLWHQPTRHSGRGAEEGIYIINCCSVRMTAGCRCMFTLYMLFLFSLQWKAEIQDFCPSTRILLIGCKTDLRTDVCTRMELSNQKQTPISHEQVCSMTTLSSSVTPFSVCCLDWIRCRSPPFL